MQVETKHAVFLLGALGGTLPTLMHTASTYVAVPSTPFPEAGLYVGIVLWAIVGGSVALMNTSFEVKQAIFAGIAAPAIIVQAVSGATDKPESRSSGLLGISAYAQEVEVPDFMLGEGGPRTVVIAPSLQGGIPRDLAIPVTAEVGVGADRELLEVGTIRSLEGPLAFTIPEGAYTVFVSGEPVMTTGHLTGVDLSVQTAPSWRGDFLWTLGVPRQFTVQDIQVTPTDWTERNVLEETAPLE